MKREVSVGIIGDFNENYVSHKATTEAIRHAANRLSVKVNTVWLPTPSFLTEEGRKRLEQFDAVWVAPGSPYQSSDGAIKGIQLARGANKPFIGT